MGVILGKKLHSDFWFDSLSLSLVVCIKILVNIGPDLPPRSVRVETVFIT